MKAKDATSAGEILAAVRECVLLIQQSNTAAPTYPSLNNSYQQLYPPVLAHEMNSGGLNRFCLCFQLLKLMTIFAQCVLCSGFESSRDAIVTQRPPPTTGYPPSVSTGSRSGGQSIVSNTAGSLFQAALPATGAALTQRMNEQTWDSPNVNFVSEDHSYSSLQPLPRQAEVRRSLQPPEAGVPATPIPEPYSPLQFGTQLQRASLAVGGYQYTQVNSQDSDQLNSNL